MIMADVVTKKPVDNRYVCNTVSQITLSTYLMTIIDACAFLFFFPHFLFMPNDAPYETDMGFFHQSRISAD